MNLKKQNICVEILRYLEVAPFMHTKASIFAYLREFEKGVSEKSFEAAFRQMESDKLVGCVLQQIGTESSKQFAATELGKAYLKEAEAREMKTANTSLGKTMKAGRAVSDFILIRLRYCKAMGMKAICREMRPHSLGFGARDISNMVRSLEESGMLQRVRGGYRITANAREYLSAQLKYLTASESKDELKDAIALLLAELSSLESAAAELSRRLKAKGCEK